MAKQYLQRKLQLLVVINVIKDTSGSESVIGTRSKKFLSSGLVKIVGSSIPVEDDEDEDDDKKRPKIYSAKIERLTYADGRDYYKVTAKGKNFEKGFNMYLGGRKSVKETRVNKRRAYRIF